MDKTKVKQRYCGNCGYHTVFSYPSLVFCGRRLGRNENPVVETLWCCEEWNLNSQECYCVEEALKAKK